MSISVKIRKGINIPLPGSAELEVVNAAPASLYALKPTDFHNLMPKLVSKEGAKVKAGETLFFDKYNEKIKYVSPVDGEVVEVVRGAKRKILEVRIKPSGGNGVVTHSVADPLTLSKDQVIDKMCEGGLWPTVKMRPLDVVAKPEDSPKMIVVTGFDSHPLAPDYSLILDGQDALFQTGVNALTKLTEGTVHLNLRGEKKQASALENCQNVQINLFGGVHPCGNAGVQIHNIDPIDKGETVWVVDALNVLAIGKFFSTGQYSADRFVALTGSKANNRKYYKAIAGAQISTITSGNVETENTRLVSGNPLTGLQVTEDDFLGFYHSQVTALPEGDRHKFFLTEGWLSLGLKRFSKSKAYPAHVIQLPEYDIDTNLNGEARAFVVTEQYEEVFPFDIFPVHLVKSIMYNDIDEMEKLGIYEVAPEDFALCEFVCTSKINVQEIVRKGLDVIQKECF